MMDFFSDVFEFEVDPVEDIIKNGSMTFKLLDQREHNLSAFAPGVEFLFKLKNLEQFKEIISKFNFFLYRKSAGESIKENFTFIEESKSFSIKDLDGRIWHFELENYQEDSHGN